jgi:hypothetical protein
VSDSRSEQLARLFEIVAGMKKPRDLRAVLGPLFELVEVAIVREQRVVSLFVGPISRGSDSIENEGRVRLFEKPKPRDTQRGSRPTPWGWGAGGVRPVTQRASSKIRSAGTVWPQKACPDGC